MNLLLTTVLLLIGFFALIKSSDIFVDAISSIASNFKVSKIMIALTVAAFGTCAPELAISFNSMSTQAGDIALANVIGSNIVNILLVVGLAAFCAPIKVKNDVEKRELPILLVVTTLFSISIITHLFDGTSNAILIRQDGILFLFMFVIFICYIISVIRVKKGIFEKGKPKYDMLVSILLTILCCILIIISSDIVVDNAKRLAEILNVSTKVITMTVVVIGTSLPEMTMTVLAAKKKEFDIALGNIIGTNIFNIGVVLGLPLVIYGNVQSINFNFIDIFFVFLAALILFLFARNDKVLSKKEGAIMLLLFTIYYAYLFLI